MLSKTTIKKLKKLEQKKYRKTYQEFKVEGETSVLEFLEENTLVKVVYASRDFFDKYAETYPIPFELADEASIEKASFYKTNTSVIALCAITSPMKKTEDFTLVLDDIQDPGNLGTIIRTCDWYGVQRVVCSPETVDAYNPKVVASTKGSLARVQIEYRDLETFLSDKAYIYGATLDGETSVYKDIEKNAVLVIGNETHGISESVQKLLTKKITIAKKGRAESLNAAIATAILLDRFFS